MISYENEHGQIITEQEAQKSKVFIKIIKIT